MRVMLPLTKEQKASLARMINPKSVEDYGLSVSVTIAESEKVIDGGLDMEEGTYRSTRFTFPCVHCGTINDREVKYFGAKNPVTHIKCDGCGKWNDTRKTATPTSPADAEGSGPKVVETLP